MNDFNLNEDSNFNFVLYIIYFQAGLHPRKKMAEKLVLMWILPFFARCQFSISPSVLRSLFWYWDCLKKTVLLLFAIKTCLRPPRSITHIFKWSHERLESSKWLSVAKIFLKIALINSRRTPKNEFWMSFKKRIYSFNLYCTPPFCTKLMCQYCNKLPAFFY